MSIDASRRRCRYDKRVYVPKELNIDLAKAIEKAQNALAETGIKVSRFMACDDEYTNRIEILRDKFIKSQYIRHILR